MLLRHGSVAVAQIVTIAPRLHNCSRQGQFVERIYGGKRVHRREGQMLRHKKMHGLTYLHTLPRCKVLSAVAGKTEKLRPINE